MGLSTDPNSGVHAVGYCFDRSDSGYRIYINTARRITSGEVLK